MSLWERIVQDFLYAGNHGYDNIQKDAIALFRTTRLAIFGIGILTIICILLIVHQIKLRKEIRKLRELIQDKP